MGQNKEVKNFVNVFAGKNIYEIAEGYEQFKESAILQFKDYQECIEKISKELKRQKEDPMDPMKVGFYTTMVVMDRNLKDDLRKIEPRQRFIDDIGERISWAYEEAKNQSKIQEESIDFLIMRVILDMCFAYVDTKVSGVSRLQLPAMFYDLMCKWNEDESNPEDFRKFYGEAAEQDILTRTWENVKLYCQTEACDPVEWSESQITEKKEYVRRFGEKLIQMAGDEGLTTAENTLEKADIMQSEEEQNGEEPFPSEEERKEDIYVNEATSLPSRKKKKKHENLAEPRTESQEEAQKPKEKGFSGKKIMTMLVVVAVIAILFIAAALYLEKTTTGSSERGKTTLNYNNTISAPLLLWDDAAEEAQKGDTYEYFSRN